MARTPACNLHPDVLLETAEPEEVMGVLEEYHHVRVVITNLTERGARIAYSARMDLPFRVRVSSATLKLNCWARVVRQDDGVADLEFQSDD